MLSLLVSSIFSTSSSSSTSSDGGNENDNDGDENDKFLSEPEESPSTSSRADDTIPDGLAVPDASPAVTMAFPGAHHPSIPNRTVETPPKRQRINFSGTGRQYQRLWMKQDEMEHLKGYLDYIRQHPWATNSLQNDVAFFYDHIRPKLKMAINKNQVVEKLRRLKRKHKNFLGKINSGKKVSFKNPPEMAIFEFSRKIWGKNKVQDTLDDDIDESDARGGHGLSPMTCCV